MPEPKPIRVPMSRPSINEADVEAVAAVVRSGRLALGPKSEAFERALADYVGAPHAVAVSSGTAGLHLSVAAAGIGPGDEVLTTPLSFIASTNCVLYQGATPVFVDVDPLTGNLDPARLEAALTPRTKGVVTVDLFGQPADADPILGFAEAHGLTVIEDACEALGAEYKGLRAGTLGAFGVLGFYPNKQLTTGEGGVVFTDSPERAERLRSLRNQGRDQHDAWLTHSRLGYNYRLSEMSAALGLSQLSRLDAFLASRAAVAARYDEALGALEGVEVPRLAPTTTRMSWYGYVVRIGPEFSRDRVLERLADQGIPSRVYFPALHLQPVLKERLGLGPGAFPVAEDLAARSLALPFHAELAPGEIDQVAEALATALDGARW